MLIPSGFFRYIYHVGCAINLHSNINSGLIFGGQKSSNRQTIFFLRVDPMDKNHKDLDTIDLNEPRHAQNMRKTWKKHQNTVNWVEDRIEVFSITIERYYSSRNTPSLIVFRKLFGWKLEMSCTRKYMRHLVFLQRSL